VFCFVHSAACFGSTEPSSGRLQLDVLIITLRSLNQQYRRLTLHIVINFSILVFSIYLYLVYLSKKSNPITGLDRPTGFQEVEAPRFLDSRHMKVVRLSALRTGRVYPPGNIPGNHFR
jgi:hypothetical protein